MMLSSELSISISKFFSINLIAKHIKKAIIVFKYLLSVFSIILLLNLNAINPNNILIKIVIGINIIFVAIEIFSPLLL